MYNGYKYLQNPSSPGILTFQSLVCHSLYSSSSGVSSNVFTSAVELQSVYINISLRIDFICNLQYSNTTCVYSVVCDWNVEFNMVISVWVEPWWNMLPPLSVKLHCHTLLHVPHEAEPSALSASHPDAELTTVKEQCITWPCVNSRRATVMWLANKVLIKTAVIGQT